MCCKARVLAWFVVMQPLFQSRRAQTQIPHGLHVHLTLSGVQLPKICLFCNNTKGCYQYIHVCSSQPVLLATKSNQCFFEARFFIGICIRGRQDTSLELLSCATAFIGKMEAQWSSPQKNIFICRLSFLNLRLCSNKKQNIFFSMFLVLPFKR